jgi:hypothetical protein
VFLKKEEERAEEGERVASFLFLQASLKQTTLVIYKILEKTLVL